MASSREGSELEPEAIRGFTQAILRDLRALERMLREGWIEEGTRRFGAEQELFLVGPGYSALPLALQVLERLSDEPFTTELALFNLEANLPPLRLEGDCFSRCHAELDRLLDRARAAVRAEGGELALAGILPTLTKSDLTRERMTPNPRYFTLDEALGRMRGGEYQLRVQGADEIILRHDSLMLESCNASCQVHLQVGAREFPLLFNVSQLMTAPVLAVAVNSPLLFGRRLWAETRIALFQQSLDTRAATPYVRDMSPRVRFGDRWLEESVIELFQEDLARFKILMAGKVDKDPFEEMEAGTPPALEALQLYNSTIYRWNRPCYGVSEGRAHLRIECRALPSGPSSVDEMANAAFWIGLVLGGAEAYGDPAERMDFSDVKSNFLAAARHGLNTGLRWFDGTTVSVRSLILDTLLPLARQGLLGAGVDDAEVDRYLGVIEGRASSGRTGSEWMMRSLAGMEGRATRSEQLAALTGAMIDNQRQPDRPVHRWEPARLEDAGGWTEAYARVEQYMETDPVTINEDEAVDLAAFVMDRERIRHIPVEDHDHRLVGLVSYRAFLRYLGERNDAGSAGVPSIKDIMRTDPLTVAPETPTLHALNLMRERAVGCLPVVKDGKLVGLVTERVFARIAHELLEEKLRRK